MQRRRPAHHAVLALTLLSVVVASSAQAAFQDDFLHASDQGQCIENVVYHTIQRRGAQQAAAIVQAALAVQARREAQQRALGCSGDIAAQAIAAGADPDQVLKASAAGL